MIYDKVESKFEDKNNKWNRKGISFLFLFHSLNIAAMHRNEKSIESIIHSVEREAEDIVHESEKALDELDEMARDLDEMVKEEEASCLKKISKRLRELKLSIRQYFESKQAKKSS